MSAEIILFVPRSKAKGYSAQSLRYDSDKIWSGEHTGPIYHEQAIYESSVGFIAPKDDPA